MRLLSLLRRRRSLVLLAGLAAPMWFLTPNQRARTASSTPPEVYDPTKLIAEFYVTGADAGYGLPVIGAAYCTQFASTMNTGSNAYFCAMGDKTVTNSSGYGLSEVGTVTSTSPYHCPSGTSCRTLAHFATSSGNRLVTTTVAEPTGSFSAGFISERGNTSIGTVLSKYGTTNGTRTFDIYIASNGTPHLLVAKASGTQSDLAGTTGACAFRTRCHVVGTYQYVSDGASVGVICADGSCTTSSTMVGPPTSASVLIAVGEHSTATQPFVGTSDVVWFANGVVVDATTRTAMNAYAHGVTTDTTGTYSLTMGPSTGHGFDSMIAPDGVLTWIANLAQPVASDGSLDAHPGTGISTTNPEAINSWSDLTDGVTAAPTLNGTNTITGPDLSVTAEDYSFPATTSGKYSLRYQTGASGCGTSARLVSGSIWLKAIGSNCTTDVCVQTATGSPGTWTCAAAAAVTTGWTRFLDEGITIAASTGGFGVGNATGLNGGTDRAACRVGIYGSQCDSNALATAYANGLRAGTQMLLTKPGTLSDSLGAARISIKPKWSGAPSTYYFAGTSSTKWIWATSSTVNSMKATNGTVTPAAATSFTAGTYKNYLLSWSTAGNFLKMESLTDGTSDSTAFAGFSLGSTIGISGRGDSATAGQPNAYLANVRFCLTHAGCIGPVP